MKIKLLKSLMLLFCAVMLLSCDKSNGPGSEDNPPVIPPSEDTDTQMAYVLCQGNFYNGVPGGFFTIDLINSAVIDNPFEKVNGRSLGDTPQCGICYGNKIYIGMYSSNTIEVLDANSYKSIKQLSLAGSSTGTQPRSVVAHDGKVYFAMFDGYVCSLDTLKLDIDASIKVGPNPEIMCVYDNKLYVPNSDGMSYPVFGKTASVIDLQTLSVSTIQVPENPDQFQANESGLYLLSKGNYEDIPSAVYKYNGASFDKVAEATLMAVDSDKIYMVNDPFYGSGVAEYKIYDCNSGDISPWNCSGIQYASNIAVERNGHNVFVSSYIMNGQYPSYDAPGYVSIFNSDGSLINKYNIGAGPVYIFFR